ncbi:MAG: hypothetical protein ACYDFS_02070 [Vulcanimicrobiaceae bacterium]
MSSGAGTTTFTYQGYTIDADPANSYAELYDSNGNLLAQLSWNVDSTGELTATAIGSSQTRTVTMPTAGAVAAAGSVAVGDAVATLNEANSSFALSSGGQAVLNGTLGSDGTATMTPLVFSLPALAFHVPANSGGRPGGPPRPLDGIHQVRPMDTAECIAILAAILATMMLAGDAMVSAAAVCVAGLPESAGACWAMGILIGMMLSQLQTLIQQLLDAYCQDVPL